MEAASISSELRHTLQITDRSVAASEVDLEAAKLWRPLQFLYRLWLWKCFDAADRLALIMREEVFCLQVSFRLLMSMLSGLRRQKS
jgi:hypothetical protein